MAMSGNTGQVMEPTQLGGLQNRQQPMGMNTMAILNNISRPILIGAGITVIGLGIYAYMRRRRR
tara:strand:- start:231 stop:422 length:192 start_codon:yes stop_codon:yes gene_type:complete